MLAAFKDTSKPHRGPICRLYGLLAVIKLLKLPLRIDGPASQSSRIEIGHRGVVHDVCYSSPARPATKQRRVAATLGAEP